MKGRGEELRELPEIVAPPSDCNSTDSLIYSYSFVTLSEAQTSFCDSFLKRRFFGTESTVPSFKFKFRLTLNIIISSVILNL